MKIALTMLLQTTNFGNPIPIGLDLEYGVTMTISFHQQPIVWKSFTYSDP